MRNEKGQGLIEYLILVCLVGVSAIAVVAVVGTNVKEQYANISASLRGDDKGSVDLTSATKSDYQKRGMNDYRGTKGNR